MTMFLRSPCSESARDKFCGQHLMSGHTQQTPVQSMKVFRNIAGKGKSTMDWYDPASNCICYVTKKEAINFVLTRANVDDRNEQVIDTAD